MSMVSALRPLAAAIYEQINGAADPAHLDSIASVVWSAWGKGEFTDDEATFLTGAVDKRRPMGRRNSSIPGVITMTPIPRLHGRLGSRFRPRQRQRSPDRKTSRDRRRMLGGSSA